jgi:hypothetical protein
VKLEAPAAAATSSHPSTLSSVAPGDPDMDELARALSLRAEQREQVRSILLGFERELDRAMRDEGGDTTASMRAAQERAIARLDVQIASVLDPAQRAVFEKMR